MSTRTSVLKRFDELIACGWSLRNAMEDDPSLHMDDLARSRGWQTSCLHTIERTFGADSVYFKRLVELLNLRYHPSVLAAHCTEIMSAAKEEIEKGFLYKIEHLISSDFFDSVIEQSEYLLKSGFKDVAAVFGRVVIENTLKDIAKRENITVPERIQPSELNQLLRDQNIYEKNIWRLVQAQIDLGNFAAHGQFDKYDDKSVEFMLTWIRETLMNL